ncbi:U6 snRNA-associated Sm-like protein LSm7, partial [Neoconidiobolus thromboides FSU 785]
LDKPKKKKESILDLSKFLEKKVHVKFSGGREVSGILKGFDPLLNLVLDHTIEIIRGSDKTRELGLLVCRGPTVVLIHPEEEAIEISNPFLQQ